MDYRVLLKKYMRNVVANEGVAFVDDSCSYSLDKICSDEEIEELEKVKKEVLEEGIW